MTLRVLHPAGATLTEAVGSIREQAKVPATRPYVVANFVATVDGSVALDGESTPIAHRAPGDRPLFRLLREQADAVLAGTRTIERENYRRLIRDPQAHARRAAAGLTPTPLAVVLSRSGSMPGDAPMLQDPEQPVRRFTGSTADPATAFAALRDEGIRLLLCEGGPTLLGALVRADLVDELFITIAPVLGSGTAENTLLGGEPDHPRALWLAALLEQGGGLHARYRVITG